MYTWIKGVSCLTILRSRTTSQNLDIVYTPQGKMHQTKMDPLNEHINPLPTPFGHYSPDLALIPSSGPIISITLSGYIMPYPPGPLTYPLLPELLRLSRTLLTLVLSDVVYGFVLQENVQPKPYLTHEKGSSLVMFRTPHEIFCGMIPKLTALRLPHMLDSMKDLMMSQQHRYHQMWYTYIAQKMGVYAMMTDLFQQIRKTSRPILSISTSLHLPIS